MMKIGSLLSIMNETLVYDKELEKREREIMRAEYGTEDLRLFKNPNRATELRLKQTLESDKKRGWMKDETDPKEMEAFYFFNKPGFNAFHNTIAKYENSPKEYGVKKVYKIANNEKQKVVRQSLKSIYKKGSNKFYGKPIHQKLNETLVYDAPPLEAQEKEAMRHQYGTTNLRIFKDPKIATQYQMKSYIKKMRKPIMWNGLKTPTTRGQNRKNDITFYRITNEPGFMKYNTQISKYENSPKEYGVKSVYGIVGQYSHTTHAPKSDKEYKRYWNKNADKKFAKDIMAFNKDPRYKR